MTTQLSKEDFLSAMGKEFRRRLEKHDIAWFSEKGLNRALERFYKELLDHRKITSHDLSCDWSIAAAENVCEELQCFAPGDEVTVFLHPTDLSKTVNGIVAEPYFAGYTAVFFKWRNAAKYCRLKGIEWDCSSREVRLKTNKIYYKQGDDLDLDK